MKNELMTELAKMDDVDFKVLEHSISIARSIRDLMKDYIVPEEIISTALALDKDQFKLAINAAWDFDIRLISRLQSLRTTYYTERAKEDAAKEDMQFSMYKDQYPIFVERINKLLNKLELQSDDQK